LLGGPDDQVLDNNAIGAGWDRNRQSLDALLTVRIVATPKRADFGADKGLAQWMVENCEKVMVGNLSTGTRPNHAIRTITASWDNHLSVIVAGARLDRKHRQDYFRGIELGEALRAAVLVPLPVLGGTADDISPLQFGPGRIHLSPAPRETARPRSALSADR